MGARNGRIGARIGALWTVGALAASAQEAGSGGLAALPGDARFSVALYCDPTCDEAVLEGLENDLSRIESRSGFPSRISRPVRIMGLADATFGIPDADVLAAYGVEVDRPEALMRSQQVVIAWFAAPVSGAAETLATAHAAFSRAAEKAHGWVEDLDTQQVFGAAAWQARQLTEVGAWFVIDGAPADAAQPDGDLRLVTRGLRRFGLPDLVVASIDPALAADASTVLHAAALGLHGRRQAGDLELKTDQIQGIASFGDTARRDDDPEAPLWRVSFDGQITGTAGDTPEAGIPEAGIPEAGIPEAGAPGTTGPAAAPAAAPLPAGSPLLTSPAATVPRSPVTLPGASPGAVAAPIPAPPGAEAPPADLQEAQERAVARLSSVVLPAFQAGLPPREAVACSIPFPTRSGGVEYMWVELRTVQGEELTGVLVNDPRDVEGVQRGDTIVFQRQEVFDYIWKRADGSREGNTTAPFLRR